MAKLDLQAAFCMVPIWPSEWELLGMHWCGQYWTPAFPSAYVLPLEYPMSLPAPCIGSLEHNYGATLLHYLDDFLLLGPPGLPTCQDSMSTMLHVYQELGMPVVMEKSEGPATSLTFLGIVLDSSLQ